MKWLISSWLFALVSGNVSSYAIKYFDCPSVSQFTSFFGENEVEINLSTSFATHICVFVVWRIKSCYWSCSFPPFWFYLWWRDLVFFLVSCVCSPVVLSHKGFFLFQIFLLMGWVLIVSFVHLFWCRVCHYSQ